MKAKVIELTSILASNPIQLARNLKEKLKEEKNLKLLNCSEVTGPNFRQLRKDGFGEINLGFPITHIILVKLVYGKNKGREGIFAARAHKITRRKKSTKSKGGKPYERK